MYDKDELCKKITELYPEIGSCGIDVTVDFDSAQNAWLIDLKKGDHMLKHYLDNPEAKECMEGKQCVALGLDIAQLKKHIEHEQF